MSYRTTLAQAKDSRIAAALGICSDSDKFVQILNEAQQRLLSRGKWVGTYGQFSLTVNGGFVAWPRQIETVEGMTICDSPIALRNEWFEFSLAGPGFHRILESGEAGCCQKFWNDCKTQLYDRGTSPLIKDLAGNRKLKVYIDNATDASKKLFIKAKDSNGNKIYNSTTGEEGFEITLASPSVLDTHLLSEVYGVIKPETLGVVRVYEFDPSDSSQELIAIYEPSETTPCYRRSFLPWVNATDDIQIQAIAKLAFIPASFDTDFLLIGNIPALKEMCVSIKMAESEKWNEAEAAEMRAIRELESELESYLGDSAMPTMQVRNAAPVGEPVINLI